MDKVKCEICGKEVSKQGLVGHQRSRECLEIKAANEPNIEGSRDREPTGSEKMDAKRERRKAYDGRQLKMTVVATPGKVGRWVNDDGKKIEERTAQGYDFVPDRKKVGEGEDDGNTSLGDMISMRVGDKNGKPLMAYYMEIEEEFYEEDQATKQKEIDEVHDSIHANAENKMGGHAYVPGTGNRMY